MKKITILFSFVLLFVILAGTLSAKETSDYSGNITISETPNPNTVLFQNNILSPVFNSTGSADGNGVAGTIWSVKSGNWSIGSTWNTNSVPTSSDDVTISAGHTVTIGSNTITYTCNSLFVSGTLIFEILIPRTITVVASVTINPGGIFQSNVSATQTGHILSVGTNLINNGTLDFSTNNNTAGANIIFTGNNNNSFSGTGGITDIRTITINKGSTSTPVLELITTYFTVRGASTDVTDFLTLTNGTFKISGNFTLTYRGFSSAVYTIAANTGLWLNNPNFTITGQNGSPALYGTLRISNGIYNIGTSLENSMSMYTGCSFIMEGGYFNVTGRLCVNTVSEAITFNQSGGTINVCKVGNTGTLFSFDVGNSTSTSFTMSGGSIVLQLPSATGIDYRGTASVSPNITGGTLQLGNASSGTAKNFYVQGAIPGLFIDNTSAGHMVYIYDGSIIYLNTMINSSTSLICLGSINVKGNFVNNGTFGANSKAVTFSGGSAQTITGANTFYDLTINNTSGGVSLSASSNQTIDGTLSLESGAFSIGSNTIIFNKDISAGSGSLTGGASSIVDFEDGYNAASTNLPAVSGGLLQLIIHRTAGIFLTGALTINNNGTLFLTIGELTTNGYLTMASTNTLINIGYGIISATPIGTAYSLIYTGSLTDFAGHELQNNSVIQSLIINSGRTVILKRDATINGDWTNNGTLTANSKTITFNGSSNQQITGNNSNFYNLIINNTAGLTLNGSQTITNTLTLTNGVITTGSSTLTLTGASQPSGSNSSFINGRLAITSASSSPVTLNFAVGDQLGAVNNFRPVQVQNVTPGSGGKTYTISILPGPTGGTVDASLSSLTTKRYYQIQNTTGMQTGTRIQLSFGTDDLVPYSYFARVAQANTVTGIYHSVGGTVTGFDPYNLLSTYSCNSGDDYFVVGNESCVYSSAWTGNAGDSKWSTPGNWTCNQIPTPFSNVEINGLVNVDVNNVDINSLTVGGGIINFSTNAGYNFSVQNNFTQTGGVIYGNAETISLGGNWTVNGGFFIPGSSTMRFCHIGTDQQIRGTVSNVSLNNLEIYKDAVHKFFVGGNITGIGLEGNLTIHGGSFLAPGIIAINGDWTNNGGTFYPGSSTVRFYGYGRDHYINGSSVSETFNNLQIDGYYHENLIVAGSISTINILGELEFTSNGYFIAGTVSNINIAGNWSKNGGYFSPGTSTVTFNGSSTQQISGNNSNFYNFIINNASGIVLNSNQTVSNSIILTNGVIKTGSNTLLFTGASQPTGNSNSFVNGNLAISSSASSPVTLKFPVGDTLGAVKNYREVQVQNVTPGSGGQTYTVSILPGPTDGTAIPPLTSLTTKRYYRIQNTAGMQTGTRIQLTYSTDDGIVDNTKSRVAQSNTSNGIYTSIGGSVSGSNPYTLLSTSNQTTGNEYFVVGSENSVLSLSLAALLQGFYNGTVMVQDTVTVELHNASTPYTLVESKKIFLNSSGMGNPLFTIAVNGTSYYIVIKFNNGIETWSATPQTFSGFALSYDYTTAATQAYGSNMILVGTKWCIISGDVDQDGSVGALDRSACWNDRNLSGYYATDLDGDGSVGALDRSICWNNRNLSVQKPALDVSPGVKRDNKVYNDKSNGTYDLKLDGKNSKKVIKNK